MGERSPSGLSSKKLVTTISNRRPTTGPRRMVLPSDLLDALGRTLVAQVGPGQRQRLLGLLQRVRHVAALLQNLCVGGVRLHQLLMELELVELSQSGCELAVGRLPVPACGSDAPAQLVSSRQVPPLAQPAGEAGGRLEPLLGHLIVVTADLDLGQAEQDVALALLDAELLAFPQHVAELGFGGP